MTPFNIRPLILLLKKNKEMINELTRLIYEHSKFSTETFGSNRNPIGPLKHLLKEVQEVIDEPSDSEEFADCLLLFIDAIRLNGHTFEDIIYAAFKKLEKNRNREWPPLNSEGYSEHKKS